MKTLGELEEERDKLRILLQREMESTRKWAIAAIIVSLLAIIVVILTNIFK